MAVDCGIELKKHGVTMLSLYPGAVKTELITSLTSKIDENPSETNGSFKVIFFYFKPKLKSIFLRLVSYLKENEYEKGF